MLCGPFPEQSADHSTVITLCTLTSMIIQTVTAHARTLSNVMRHVTFLKLTFRKLYPTASLYNYNHKI